MISTAPRIFPILYNGPGDTPQNCPGIRVPPSETWFLGPTRVDTSDGTSIGSAVFVGLTVVTNAGTQTDTQTAGQP